MSKHARSDDTNNRERYLMKEATTNSDLMDALHESLRSVAPKAQFSGASTRLLGADAVLDSVGFLGFLISAEAALGNTVDLSAVLIEQGDIASEKSPFYTIGSLAQYIERVKSE
jgi:hypothetical protein